MLLSSTCEAKEGHKLPFEPHFAVPKMSVCAKLTMLHIRQGAALHHRRTVTAARQLLQTQVEHTDSMFFLWES